MMVRALERLQFVYSSEGLRGVGNRLFRRLHVGAIASRPEEESKLAADAGAYWSESHDEEFLRDQSHWLGHGRYNDEGLWRRIGQRHHQMVETLCRFSGRQKPIRHMVEWGPGGGANAVAFAPELASFTGVDISRPNLQQCQQQLASEGFDNFHGIAIDPTAPETVLGECQQPCDLFLCTAVYQHFPSKQYGERVTNLAARLLNRDGVALIQIRYDDGKRKFRAKTRDYKANATFFTSYAIDEFWTVAESAGFEPLAVRLNPQANYAYYFLKNRGAS